MLESRWWISEALTAWKLFFLLFFYLFVIFCVIYAGLSDVQMIYLPAGVRHLEQGK